MTEITTISSSVDNLPQNLDQYFTYAHLVGAGLPREPEENRAGFQLYQELRTVFLGSPLKHIVEAKLTVCLSACLYCVIAFSSPVPGVISSEISARARYQ